MGIQFFHAWLNKYHIKHYTKTIITKCDYLCIDFNTIIHQRISNYCIEKNQNLNNLKNYNELFDYIFNYVDELIILTKPTKKIFIAIDGVAPLAKMQQQRTRRIKHSIIKDNTEPLYNPNNISPGTIFMIQFRNYIINKALEYNNIIVSNDLETSEGEQKIFNFIKSKTNNNDNIYIYGLDSDLILLSYIVNKKITLIFNKKNNNIIKDLEYFNIISFKDDLKINGFDLILIVSLFGNDFLPNTPFLSIFKHLNKAIDIYKNYYEYNKTTICNNGYIDIYYLRQYLYMLSKYEINKINNSNDINLDTVISDYDNQNDLNEKIQKIIDLNKQINIYKPPPMVNVSQYTSSKYPYNHKNHNEFIKKYYNKKFNTDRLNIVIFSYLKILQWNILYYRDSRPPDWRYMYKYDYSPFIYTISQYLNINQNINIYTFNKNHPLKSEEQLLYILPKEDIINFMPLKYHDFIIKNENFYKNYKIELYNLFKKDKALILLKNMNINNIIKYYNNI